MNKLKYTLNLFVAIFMVVACETYGDYEIKYTPLYPMSGRYNVNINYTLKDAQNRDSVCHVSTQIYLANTQDNSLTQCWIRTGSYSSNSLYSINGKINYNIDALTFEGSNITNLAGNVVTSSETFTLTEGKIILEGVMPPSGRVKVDSIAFNYTISDRPGVTFAVTGHRYTFWPED